MQACSTRRSKSFQQPAEQEKALKETVIRVKSHSIEEATRNLEPTDIQGLQRLMEDKRALQDLEETAYFYQLRIKYKQAMRRMDGLHGRKHSEI